MPISRTPKSSSSKRSYSKRLDSSSVSLAEPDLEVDLEEFLLRKEEPPKVPVQDLKQLRESPGFPALLLLLRRRAKRSFRLLLNGDQAQRPVITELSWLIYALERRKFTDNEESPGGD